MTEHQKGIDTMTIRENYEAIRKILVANGETELVDFIDGRIAQTVKKNSGERKPTAKQIENTGFKAEILAWMDADTIYTSADVQQGCPSLVAAGLSPNRVSALMTALEKEGAVTSTIEKRKHYYRLSA